MDLSFLDFDLRIHADPKVIIVNQQTELDTRAAINV